MNKPRPPRGYTAKQWDAMIRVSDVLCYDDDGDPPPQFCVPFEPTPLIFNGIEVPFGQIVYFIKCGDFIKIGESSSLKLRLVQLQAMTPFDLELIAYAIGGRALERSLHQRFAKYRHRFEWFRYEGELATWIEQGGDANAS